MSKRIPQLDGLRAVAILAVFLRHAFDVRMMWMGVDIFFVLSGFLITGILLDMQKENFGAFLRQFYDRRVKRILPPYVLLLVVGSALFGFGWTRQWFLYLGLTNYTLRFPSGFFAPFDALWSLGVEEQFYLVWPVVVFLVRPKWLPAVLAGTMLAAPLLRAVATPWLAHQPWDHYHWLIYKGTPFRMDCLAMGGLLTFAWRAHEGKIRRYGYLGLMATVLAPAAIILLDRRIGGFSTVSGTIRGNVVTLELTLCAATGIFLWALGGRFTGILTVAPMQFLGKISYTFYLIHESFILLAQRNVPQRLAGGLAFLASVVFATASWYWMEKPILSSGSKRVRRQEVEAAQPALTMIEVEEPAGVVEIAGRRS